MNKREFVWAAGAAAASGAVVPAVAMAHGAACAGVTHASPASANAEHGLADWQARVGERYAVFGIAKPVQLTLSRVDVHAASCARTEQFSLVFERHGAALADGTQVLAQGGSAPLALYLVQSGTGESGVPLLRADCNQLI
jgi:hypothetical protein